MISNQITHFTTENGNQHGTQMGNHNLNREVGLCTRRSHSIHRSRVNDNSRKSVCPPQQTNTGIQLKEGRGVHGYQIKKHPNRKIYQSKTISSSLSAHEFDNISSQQSSSSSYGRAHDARHKSDFFHIIPQINHIGFEHCQYANQSGVIEY